MLYTPSSPHFHANTSVRKIMMTVMLALVPGTILSVWFLGWGVLIQLGIAIIAGLFAEAIMLFIRRRPLTPFLGDGSVVLTGWFLALCIPPTAPWWIIVFGVVFAVVIAKHLYGGLGYNLFNPAMIGYAMLLISFPKEMTQWLNLPALALDNMSFSDAGRVIFGNPVATELDAMSSATPLDYIKTQLGLERGLTEIQLGSSRFGNFGSASFEWIAIAFLLGGLWLIRRGVIQWQIPLAMLSTLFILASLFYMVDPERYSNPVFHLFAGATMLGAFFIATDPVSAATTPHGKIWFGIGIGALVYVIRTWGGYPDGIAFAVLLMNLTAPTIDYYTRPKPFGHE